MIRTMSACCLTVYAKSPGFAIEGRSSPQELSGKRRRNEIYRSAIAVEKLWESRRFSQRLSKTQALFTNFSCCHAERRRIGHKPILHSRSIPTGITALHPWIPILGQVQPVWIPQFDHRYLLRPRPAFQLFLSPDCLVHVVVGRPVQKSLHLVPVGETLHLMELMLEHAFV